LYLVDEPNRLAIRDTDEDWVAGRSAPPSPDFRSSGFPGLVMHLARQMHRHDPPSGGSIARQLNAQQWHVDTSLPS
jgi:hypothetical protein